MRNGILCALLLIVTFASAIEGAGDTVFSDIFGHYESIRQVLIEDSTEGVALHADAIADAAVSLAADFSPAAAGVDSAEAAAVKALLSEIETRASGVASADSLEGTRDELAELTKPLVRWHELINGPRPVVAYCPMVKKAWLQPDEAIGNPYAPTMLRCGDIVQR